MARACGRSSVPERPINLLLKYLDSRHSTNSNSYTNLVKHFTDVHNVNFSGVRRQAKCRTTGHCSLLRLLLCTRSDVHHEVRWFTESERSKPQMIIVTGNIMSHICHKDLRVLQSIGYRIASFNLSSRRFISGMSTRKSITHYYEVLGLNPNATQGQIKAAYYKLSKLHHPDVTECNKSHSLFTEISEAYEILGNLRKRRMYDRGVFNPRDTRGDTVDDEAKDYTQAYKKGFNFERGNRPPPPTGRSKIYNFDEFYRQHYNDIRERRSAEIKEYAKYKEMKNKKEEVEFYLPLLFVFCSLFIVTSIVMLFERYDTDHLLKPHQTRDSPTPGQYFSPPNSISASTSPDAVK